MKYRSILDTVGTTPVVELSQIAPAGIKLYGKLESFNPMGSVKDRMALAVIERAEREGVLKPGQTVIEATSGNTGIGLAMVCARKGYPFVATMAESFSVERRRLMRFLGAKVVLTPAALKGSGMYLKAVELAEKHGWFLARQFETEANADAHTETTAQEILQDFEGERLDYWVTTVGTGGTLKGVARALRAARPETRVIAVEADNAQIMGGGVPQPPATAWGPASHPRWQPHPIQGTTPDFVSKLAADAMAAGYIDQILPVNGGEAMRLARELARREGIFVGISSGAALAGALKLAETAAPGATILCMLPDTGERYLSTPLFEDTPTDMTEEETEISRSTPAARFDIPAAPRPAAMAEGGPSQSADPEAEEALAAAISSDPVVVFALEWCEFCWSVRNAFKALGIPYRSVDIDSVAYQKNDIGPRVRRALTAKTGIPTIPQVFIGGALVGGAVDTFDAYRDGSLQNLLNQAAIRWQDKQGFDPYDMLPKWLLPKPQVGSTAT
jgi:cysteine synthase A